MFQPKYTPNVSVNFGCWNKRFTCKNSSRIRSRKHKVYVRPIKRLDARHLNIHRVIVNVFDNRVLGVWVSERRCEYSHLLKPFDVRLVRGVKLFEKTSRYSITHLYSAAHIFFIKEFDIVNDKKMIAVDKVNKILLAWSGFCLACLSLALGNTSGGDFFSFGPSDKLVILDIKINTAFRYSVVLLYTIVSTLARTVLQEIVSPWLIQTIQNDKPKNEYALQHAQEIALGECFYRWFDWFMYMHILLAQIDMMIVELIGNLVAVSYTTRMYTQKISQETI